MIYLAVIMIGIYWLYRILIPVGPITNGLPNPIADKSSGPIDESDIIRNPLKEAYFGDLQIHIVMSHDAYIEGIRTTPEEAYQFAKGARFAMLNTIKAKIERSLYFAALTDLSEFSGLNNRLFRVFGYLNTLEMKNKLLN